MARETVSRLMRAMKSLSRDARMVCELRFFDDLSIDEIAETLRMNPETVKSHIRRSRIFLRQALKDEEEV
jgi:RNA polymerase sigma-70 factor (ECF subfamily)